MQKLYFWTEWPKAQRVGFYLAASISILALLLYIVSFWLGESFMLIWQTQGIIEPIKINLTWIEQYLLEVPLVVDSLRITEQFYAERLALNLQYSYLFLASFGLVWISLLAISSQLSRWWYFISTTMLMLILVGFRMENLGFLGFYNHTLLGISFVLFFPIGYYFHFFKNQTPFWVRWITFAFLSFAFCLLVYFFSEATIPFARLIHYGFLSPLILSIAFLFLVAHDIPAAFLNVLTNSSSGGERANFGGYLTHFLVFTSIYILNLFIAFLHISGRVDWGISYIHPFIILPISALVGLWMMRQRSEALYSGILPFNRSGVLLYLAMAFNCFVSIAYFNITANDPLIEVMEDLIMFSHIGVGLIFMVYVLANFFGMMIKGQATHRILYKPMNMPYFTARLGGTIAAVAFFFYTSMAPFIQSTSGYFNSIGDLYALNQDDFVAEEYYKLGSQYGYNNHHSNYALFSLANKAGDTYASSYYLKKALEKNPSPQAFANLALEYEKENKIFDAIFVLRNGLKVFPDHGQLYNNLGLLFSKTELTDSAFYYLKAASLVTSIQGPANANLLALIAKKGIALPIDSLVEDLDKTYAPIKINLQHLGNMGMFTADNISDTSSAKLSPHQFAFQYNQALNRFQNLDTSGNYWIERLMMDSSNLTYKSSLELIHILNLYRNGNTSESIRLLGDARYASRQFAPYYSYLMGLEALDFQSKEFAGFNLEFAAINDEKDAFWALMMLRLSEGDTNDALEIIQKIKQERLYPDRTTIVLSLEKAISVSINHIDSLLDIEKYWMLAFRSTQMSTLEKLNLIDKIQMKELRFKAKGTYASYLMDELKLKEAGELLKEMDLTSEVSSQTELDELKLRHALHSENRSEIEKLAKPEKAATSSLHLWASAKTAQWNNDSTLAKTLFQKLGRNRLFEEGLLAAANYFQSINEQDLAYNILVEATRINPFSINIKKAYALQALRFGMENYGEEMIVELKMLMKPEDFDYFFIRFNNLKEEQRRQSAEWN